LRDLRTLLAGATPTHELLLPERADIDSSSRIHAEMISAMIGYEVGEVGEVGDEQPGASIGEVARAAWSSEVWDAWLVGRRIVTSVTGRPRHARCRVATRVPARCRESRPLTELHNACRLFEAFLLPWFFGPIPEPAWLGARGQARAAVGTYAARVSCGYARVVEPQQTVLLPWTVACRHAGASSNRSRTCCFQPVVSSHTVGGLVGAGVLTRSAIIQACFEIGCSQPVNHGALEYGSTQYLLNFFSDA
jgi:hypothetical protein